MKTFNLILILIFLSAYSCKQQSSSYHKAISSSTEAMPPSDMATSSAAVENGKSQPERKFIRTADLKFKVKSVVAATYNIEDITTNNGGFVTNTKLESRTNYINTIKISKDSSLVSTNYNMVNDITIRIPNMKLDTTLKAIGKNIDHLEYRIIKADDVALQLLSNDLTIQRLNKSQNQVSNAIANRGKKLKETVNAEEIVLSKQEIADQARISNLDLNDKINFSTVNISIYQADTNRSEVIANDDVIVAYEPGFLLKLWQSVTYSWQILENIILFFAKLWTLALLGILAYTIVARNKKYIQSLRNNL